MSDERLRTKAELKRLFTGLRDKDITDEMMSIAIDSLWRDKTNQRTTGFEFPGHFDSEISFNTNSRIFSIKPWDPQVEGFKPRFGIYAWTNPPVFNRIYDTLEIEIPDEEGLYCVYFDDEPGGTIQILFCKKNPTTQELETIYLSKVIISFLYWDAQSQSLIYFGDDRHGSEWNPQMQRYLHQSFAARRKTGLQFTNFEINGDGSNNNHLFLTITAGTILHDDIELEIPEAYGTIPILYFDNHLPRFLISTGFAYYPGCNTDQIELTTLASGNFVIFHYFATNEIGDSSRKIIAVMGIEQYTTLQAAYTGNRAELNQIEKSLPMQGRCYIDSAIFHYSDDYTNDLKSRLIGFVSSLLQSGGGGAVSGLGMNFVTGQPADMGVPSTIDSVSQNELTETSHTHKLGDIELTNIKVDTGKIYLYSQHVVFQANNITSDDDWVVASKDDWADLFSFASGSIYVIGTTLEILNKFRLSDVDLWDDLNVWPTLNELGFNAGGLGSMFVDFVGHADFKMNFRIWTSDANYAVQINKQDVCMIRNDFLVPKVGASIVLLNKNTLLADGETGIYIGNNGVEYPTFCINGVEWTTPIREELYRDLTDLIYVDVVNDGWGITWESIPDEPRYCIVDYIITLRDHKPVVVEQSSLDLLNVDENQKISIPNDAFEQNEFYAIKNKLWQKIVLDGEPGQDCREVELSTSGGYIVWRYAGDIDWINLCLIPADGAPGVDGVAGTNGNDGRDVEFSVVYNHVVWRFVGDETWIDLFELPADGNDGATGAAGANGNTPYIQGGYWYIDGVSTGVLAAGTPGANGNTPYISGGYWYINGVSTGWLATGPQGATGTSRYTYAAYASTNTGTGWSLTPTNALKYRAEIYTTTPLTPPTVGNFSGATWLKYIGDDGENGVIVTQVTGLTVLASGWVADGSLFKYELSDPSITSASIVEVIPSNSSYDVLIVAKPMPETVSSTGIVTFWAKAIPTENISVTINITDPL